MSGTSLKTNLVTKLLKENLIIFLTILVIVVIIIFDAFSNSNYLLQKRAKKAQDLGFYNIAEMEHLQNQGYATKQDFFKAEAIRLGFNTIEEMYKLKALGFKDKREYLDNLKANAEKQKAENEKLKAENEAARLHGFFSFDEAKDAERWQKKFFVIISEYFWKKVQVDDLARSLGIPANRTREEFEDLKTVEKNAKSLISEIKGRKLYKVKCTYVGRKEIIADTELWCDGDKIDEKVFFKVKINSVMASEIKRIYFLDKFVFSGEVIDFKLINPYNTQRDLEQRPSCLIDCRSTVRVGQPTLTVRAINIQRIGQQ